MPRRWLRIQIFVAVLVTVASLTGQVMSFFFHHDSVMGFVRAFNVDLEDNLSSWWQSATLVVTSVLAAVLCATTSSERAAERGGWWTISAGMAFLSADEMLAFHEHMTAPKKWLAGRPDLDAYTWIIPGICFVALAGLVLRRYLVSFGATTARRLVLAFAVYFAGAIGGELLSGLFAWLEPARGFGYVLVVHLEEFLEMLGVAIITWSMSEHFAARIELRRASTEVEAVFHAASGMR